MLRFKIQAHCLPFWPSLKPGPFPIDAASYSPLETFDLVGPSARTCLGQPFAKSASPTTSDKSIIRDFGLDTSMIARPPVEQSAVNPRHAEWRRCFRAFPKRCFPPCILLFPGNSSTLSQSPIPDSLTPSQLLSFAEHLST